MSKGFEVKLDKKALMEAAKQAAQKEVELDCPKCGSRITIKDGEGACPVCGERITLDFRLFQ